MVSILNSGKFTIFIGTDINCGPGSILNLRSSKLAGLILGFCFIDNNLIEVAVGGECIVIVQMSEEADNADNADTVDNNIH